MMDFLNSFYFDNTVRSYLVVAATILFVFLFKTLLSKYIATLIFRLMLLRWKNIERRQFMSLLVNPLSWFLVILISVIAIDKLNFPSAWNISIYHIPLEIILNRIGYLAVIIAFVSLVLGAINFISIVLKQQLGNTDKEHNQLIIFFRDFFKVVTYIFGALLLLKVVFNRDIGTLLTGLSIVGAAMALAAKESIENIIASFIIFLDKPFFTGDTVKVNTFSGKVEHIGLRSTKIRTNEKTLITVPNKQMVDSVVDNLSFRNFRRAEIRTELSQATSADALLKFISDVKNLLEAKKELLSSWSVFVTDYTKAGIMISTEFFSVPVPMNDFNKIKEDIMIGLLGIVQDSGIELASSQSNITIMNTDAGEDAPSKSNPII